MIGDEVLTGDTRSVATQAIRSSRNVSLTAHSGAIWVGLGALALVALFVLAGADVWEQSTLWENLHWTTSAVLAVAIAGIATATGESSGRRLRWAATTGLAMYAVAALAWDLQVALGFFLVPAPSDVLFLGAAAPIAGALLLQARQSLSRGEVVALGLDGLAIVFSVATAILFIFAPIAAGTTPAPGLVLLAYPIVFVGLGGLALLVGMASGTQLRDGGIYLLAVSMMVIGVTWALWIEAALRKLPPAGSAVNMLSSVAIVMAGVGVATWRGSRAASNGSRLLTAVMRTVLPILAVLVASGFLILTHLADQRIGGIATEVAAWSVIAITIVRQTVLLIDRTRYLARERETADRERDLRSDAERALLGEATTEARYRRIVTVFGHLGERLTLASNESQMLAAAATAITELGAAERGEIALINASRDRLMVGLGWGLQEREAGTAIGIESPLACFGIRRGGFHAIDDVTQRFATVCPAFEASLGSVSCLPLVATGQVVGVVHLATLAPPSDDQREHLIRIAEQVALALANARLVQTMEGLALTDSLTGLYNSRFFDPYLERELANAARDGTSVGLVMIDIDQFKQFNDTFGHTGGDEALRVFAGIALSAIRKGDTLARYGGEEFVLLVRDADVGAAMRVAEGVRAAIEATVIDIGAGRSARITASFGVVASASSGTDRMALLRTADQALYRAKREGRNRVTAADQPFPAPTASAK